MKTKRNEIPINKMKEEINQWSKRICSELNNKTFKGVAIFSTIEKNKKIRTVVLTTSETSEKVMLAVLNALYKDDLIQTAIAKCLIKNKDIILNNKNITYIG